MNYGWAGYVNLQGATDSAADGDFIEWWLTQMAQAEQTAGKRLVDDLDLHWYPEATGGGNRITDNGTSAAEVAAREQAPRSLWDSTYTETSWITQDSTMGPIDLIPRMMGKIASKYPGTHLSFTRVELRRAARTSAAASRRPTCSGSSARTGCSWRRCGPRRPRPSPTRRSTSIETTTETASRSATPVVSATTDDVPDSSVYAGLDSSDDTRLVLVAINKATTTKNAGIQIFHSVVYSKANIYTLTAAGGPMVVAGAPISAVAENAFQYAMPAQSVSVIELVQ